MQEGSRWLIKAAFRRGEGGIFRRGEFSLESGYWDDDGPTSGRDIINECDYDYYYSD
jgi:hypothetical protein